MLETTDLYVDLHNVEFQSLENFSHKKKPIYSLLNFWKSGQSRLVAICTMFRVW